MWADTICGGEGAAAPSCRALGAAHGHNPILGNDFLVNLGLRRSRENIINIIKMQGRVLILSGGCSPFYRNRNRGQLVLGMKSCENRECQLGTRRSR